MKFPNLAFFYKLPIYFRKLKQSFLKDYFKFHGIIYSNLYMRIYRLKLIRLGANKIVDKNSKTKKDLFLDKTKKKNNYNFKRKMNTNRYPTNNYNSKRTFCTSILLFTENKNPVNDYRNKNISNKVTTLNDNNKTENITSTKGNVITTKHDNNKTSYYNKNYNKNYKNINYNKNTVYDKDVANKLVNENKPVVKTVKSTILDENNQFIPKHSNINFNRKNKNIPKTDEPVVYRTSFDIERRKKELSDKKAKYNKNIPLNKQVQNKIVITDIEKKKI